jgi:hypothetical protein
LASDVGHLMHVHQGEHHRVEHGQHLSHRWQADATLILSPSVASRRQWSRFSTAQCARVKAKRRWEQQCFCDRVVQP